MSTEELSRRQLLWLAATTEGGLFLLAWLLDWLLATAVFARLSWHWEALEQGVLLCLPMLLLFYLCLRWPLGPLRSLRQFAQEVIRPLFQPCTIADLAIVSLLAGAGEELLFRGVLQTWLTELLGAWPALGITAVAFGLAHPISRTYVALATLLGLYLGIAVHCGASVLDVILAHALYDWIALLALRLGGVPGLCLTSRMGNLTSKGYRS